MRMYMRKATARSWAAIIDKLTANDEKSRQKEPASMYGAETLRRSSRIAEIQKSPNAPVNVYRDDDDDDDYLAPARERRRSGASTPRGAYHRFTEEQDIELLKTISAVKEEENVEDDGKIPWSRVANRIGIGKDKIYQRYHRVLKNRTPVPHVWEAGDLELIGEMIKAGKSWGDIGRKLGRSDNSCRQYWTRRGASRPTVTKGTAACAATKKKVGKKKKSPKKSKSTSKSKPAAELEESTSVQEEAVAVLEQAVPDHEQTASDSVQLPEATDRAVPLQGPLPPRDSSPREEFLFCSERMSDSSSEPRTPIDLAVDGPFGDEHTHCVDTVADQRDDRSEGSPLEGSEWRSSSRLSVEHMRERESAMSSVAAEDESALDFQLMGSLQSSPCASPVPRFHPVQHNLYNFEPTNGIQEELTLATSPPRIPIAYKVPRGPVRRLTGQSTSAFQLYMPPMMQGFQLPPPMPMSMGTGMPGSFPFGSDFAHPTPEPTSHAAGFLPSCHDTFSPKAVGPASPRGQSQDHHDCERVGCIGPVAGSSSGDYFAQRLQRILNDDSPLSRGERRASYEDAVLSGRRLVAPRGGR